MILLVDMDAFFASVEQQHHPHLRGKPVIVCGDPSRRGVVTAASYEARPFGVHAGMPLAEARRLCPEAEYVEGNPSKYVALSLELLQLYATWTPDVEPFSVDEAFVGLDPRIQDLAEAAEVARKLQAEVDQRFGLGCSIGIGPNKLIAKMASGVDKPRGLTALDEPGFRQAFWPRPTREMWGIGPQLEVRLLALGIRTIADLANAESAALKAAFGIIGPQLREAAWGRDDTPLTPYHRAEDPKSMGHEVTLTEDCADASFLEGTVLRLADQVARRMRSEGFVGRTVTLKLRDRRFHTVTRNHTLSDWTDDHLELFVVVRGLLRKHWDGGPVRLLGVSVSMLSRRAVEGQAELFERDRRSLKLRATMDMLRDRLGEASLVPAGSLTHRRKSGVVPFGTLSGRTLMRQAGREEQP